jgi:hypothetical protein
MRVTRVREGASVEVPGGRRVECRVAFDDGTESGLWFERSGPEPVAVPGDVVLAALLPGALAVREDLVIDGAVSSALLATSRERVLPTLVRFHPGYDAIEVRATETRDDATLPPSGPGVALFYSGGLDSSHALARNRERVTDLVFVHGLDLGMRWKDVRQAVLRDVKATAHELDLGLVEVSTRIRTTLYRAIQERARAQSNERVRFILEWSLGCLLAGLGQLLSDRSRSVIVAGSWDDSYRMATGSHPDLEPAFSTPRLHVELDGVGVSRMDKALELAEHAPEWLPRLRVCQARPHRPYNCGRCPKCLRLRMELRVAGIAPELQPFDAALDDRTLRRSFVNVDGYFWPDILRWAELRGEPETARTVEIMMERRFHLGREITRFFERRRHPGALHLRRKSRPAT